MKSDKGETDFELRQEHAAALSNTIVDCMRANGMTLQNLDEAVAIIEDVYRKNAKISYPL